MKRQQGASYARRAGATDGYRIANLEPIRLPARPALRVMGRVASPSTYRGRCRNLRQIMTIRGAYTNNQTPRKRIKKTCRRKELVMNQCKNITGLKFGRLTVIRRAPNNKHGGSQWLCVCECGQQKIITGGALNNGRTRSCGCLHKEQNATGIYRGTHFMTNTKDFRRWIGMRERCYNQKNKAYKNYGGRGISVHSEWENNFKAFYDHIIQLENYGKEGYTLDRINNDGNYEPGNVRWATRSEQSLNTRRAKLVTA